jgi:hypothetical protein
MDHRQNEIWNTTYHASINPSLRHENLFSERWWEKLGAVVSGGNHCRSRPTRERGVRRSSQKFLPSRTNSLRKRQETASESAKKY